MPVGPDAPRLGGQQAEAQDQDGAPIEVTVEDPTASAYSEMERRESAEIMRGLTGQEISAMTYDIPFRDRDQKQGGVVECSTPGWCKYRDKERVPHVHVQGIGAQGMDEIKRIYEGIQVVVTVKPHRVHKRNKYYWEAEAVALDCFTANMTTASATQPEVDFDSNRKGNDPRAEFAPRIAERKAKRNAVGELIPQAIQNALKKWASEGKTLFTPEEAQRLIDSFGYNRKQRPIRCMLDPKTGTLIAAASPQVQVLSSGGAATAPALPAAPVGDLPSPPPAKSPPPKKPPSGKKASGEPKKGRKATEKQSKMLFAVMKKNYVPENEFQDFLIEAFDIDDSRKILSKDVDAAKKWLENYIPGEAPATPDAPEAPVEQPPTEGGADEDPYDGMDQKDIDAFMSGVEE